MTVENKDVQNPNNSGGEPNTPPTPPQPAPKDGEPNIPPNTPPQPNNGDDKGDKGDKGDKDQSVEGLMDSPKDGKPGNKDGDDDKDKNNNADFDDTKLVFGENSNIDDEKKKEFVALCKENKLSVDTANKLIDFQAKLNAKYEAQRVSAINDWKVQVKKNYGPDFQTKLKAGRKALETYGSKELIEILGDKSTGLGNHPAVVDFLVKVGEKLSDDKFVRPGGSGNVSLENRTESQKAKSLYPDME